MEIHILSGASGSGKSRLAGWLKENGAVVCSADDFFMNNGKYVYDPEKIGGAHAACLRDFVHYIRNKQPVIVVDNTSIDIEDIAPYYALGVAYEYRTSIFTTLCDPSIAYSRCTHNVPWSTIQSMCARLENRKLPYWWKEDRVTPKGNSDGTLTLEENEKLTAEFKQRRTKERE